MLGVSLALFVVSALLEGAITLAVIQALEAIQPGFVEAGPGQRLDGHRAPWVVARYFWRRWACFLPPTASGRNREVGHANGLGIACGDSVHHAFFRTTKPHFLPLRGCEKPARVWPGLGLIFGVCVLVRQRRPPST